MTWEFETAEGHTIRVTLTPDAAAVSTRYVNGAVDGELFDLETFEESVLPAMLALADEATEASLRAALADLRVRRDRDDDEIP